MMKIKSRLTVAFPVIILVTILSLGITAGGYYFILSRASNIKRNEKYINEIQNIQNSIYKKQEIATGIALSFDMSLKDDFSKAHDEADAAIQKLLGYSQNLSEDDVQSLNKLKELNDSSLNTFEKELMTALAEADKAKLESLFIKRKDSYEKINQLGEELEFSVQERISSAVSSISKNISQLKSSINEKDSRLEDIAAQLGEIEKRLKEDYYMEPGARSEADARIRQEGDEKKTGEGFQNGFETGQGEEDEKVSHAVPEAEGRRNDSDAGESIDNGYKVAEQIRLAINAINNLTVGTAGHIELLDTKAVGSLKKELDALSQLKGLAALTDEKYGFPAEALVTGSEDFDGYNTQNEALNQCFRQLESLLPSSDVGTLNEIKALVETLDAEYNELLSAIENINKGTVAGAFGKIEDELGQCIDMAETLENSFNKYLDADFDTSEKIKTGILAALLVITLISVVTGYILATALSGVNKSIKGMIDYLERVHRGDLKARVPVTRDDEIGELGSKVNNVLEEHQTITDRIRETADDISRLKSKLVDSFNSGKNNVRHISGELSEFFESFKRSIKSSGMQKSNEGFESRAENIQQVVSNVVDKGIKVLEIAEKEKQSASEAEEIINKVAETVRSITDSINQLDESSGKIGDITNKITEIASKTNLLALNAAIEAARAGKEGQGFTVVAEEIRKLSEASNKAAHEIKAQIVEIQDKIKDAAESIGSGFVEFEEGAGKVSNVKTGMHEIIKSIQTVVKSVETVAKTAGTQSRNAGEMARILDTIEETAANAAGKGEYISRSIEEQNKIILGLEELALSLDQATARLHDVLKKYSFG
ncbi:MAG TPA: HAMP domain-containing protein [Clostridiaceae bacterium]|nr:HAMP domain-containing protein [Clostridiaceae bacterium]